MKYFLILSLGFSLFYISSLGQTSSSIQGRIFTSNGEAAPYVTVSLLPLSKKTISSEAGTYAFKELQPGTYTLLISHTGLQSQQQQIVLHEHEVKTINFVLLETYQQLQEVIVNSRKSVNENVVSVSKLPASIFDIPQSIDIVDKQLIRNQQALRLSDVVKNVNGVYLATTRGSTQESFSARGYSFSSNNMFKNGTRINTGAMPEVSSLERVEVLKGSAAILYGNVAPGGILNMITKQPKFENGKEITMLIGSYDLYKPTIDIYGPFNSKIAYRLNGSYETANSYRDVVHSKRYYINPSLLFNLGKRTNLLIQGDYLRHKFTPDFGIGTLNNTIIAPLSRSTYLGVPWAYCITQQATSSATLTHQLNETWQLKFTGDYQLYKRNYYSTERIQAAANGDWARPLNRIKTKENYYTAQLDITGKLKTGAFQHTLLFGTDVERYFTVNYNFNQPAIYDTINILDPTKYTARTDVPEAFPIKNTETPVNRFGVYVQDLISLSRQLKFLAGIRWSYQHAEVATTNDLIGDTSFYAAAAKTDKAFSPRIGLVYQPLGSLSFFASYANSFSVNSGTDVYGNALQPSLINQFELGIKNDFFKSLLSVNITAYRIVNNNLAQMAPFLADGITPNNNSNIKELTGQTTSDGIEVDISGKPLKQLDIKAGYSYNYMRYTKTSGEKGSYIEGERLVNNPAHTANATLFYNFDKSTLKGFKIGASVFYTGKRFGGWNNTVGQTQNYSRLIPVEGFTTIDISIGYSYKHFTLLTKLSNLTNTFNYYVHENYSINPIPPRQITATLSYRF